MDQRKALSILVILTGGLLSAQCLLLLNRIVPIHSNEIGTIATGTLSLIVFQMISLSGILAICAILQVNKDEWAQRIVRKKAIGHLPLFIGSLLAVEGLITINISGTIVSGMPPSSIMLIGIQLFSLGILALASYVARRESTTLRWKVPNHAPLLMLLFLLPAGFLIS